MRADGEPYARESQRAMEIAHSGELPGEAAGRDAALQPKPKQTIRVQAYDDDGRLVHDLDLQPPASGPGYHMVTGVREHGGKVWVGSLHEPSVAVLDLP